jgi:HxlR-like helix-turn-helix
LLQGRTLEYRLTPAGRDLHPVVQAIGEWGDLDVHRTRPDELDPDLSLVRPERIRPGQPLGARAPQAASRLAGPHRRMSTRKRTVGRLGGRKRNRLGEFLGLGSDVRPCDPSSESQERCPSMHRDRAGDRGPGGVA